MTRLVLATSIVPGDLAGKLKAIAAAGFSGVELAEADLIGFSGTAGEIGSIARDLGLRIDVFHGLADFEGLKGKDREAAFSRLAHKLAQMNEMGARCLRVTASTREDCSDDTQAFTADFAELAERVGQAGCRAALLAVPWARYVKSADDALAIVEAVDSQHFGIVLNSALSLAGGVQAARLRNIPGHRIFQVQVPDTVGHPADELPPARDQIGLLPGQGGLNLTSFVKVLARSGYDGPWSVAYAAKGRVAGSRGHARDAYRALVTLLDEVARTEPAMLSPLDDLPPRVHATGLEFVEFATDDAAHCELTGILGSLGFRRERRHRTKAVELWRQGAVNIVINSEARGFASRARAEHGPCVCDMGLRVRDADQTARRARMLGAPAFSQPVGAGELDIPAVKGVGGSVVHFIDEKSELHRVWDIEFDPVPRSTVRQPTGLRRIDHVAQTMRYDEMQSWLTYYLSTFEMEKADVVDVADPQGVVLSQALSSPEGEVRLNLNGAGESQTFAGSFLSKAVGAGVQHIAFATDDIFETSTLLAAAGFDRLPIPANYYDDLEHRFDLDADLISRLREENILYDRDGKGTYLQIYSKSFWGGFFFEIVERRNGYQGYGARNAPIRLAAQMQQSTEPETA